MNSFLDEEKVRQAGLKSDPSLFPPAACEDGTYEDDGRTYPFCLPAICLSENLYVEIRQAAIDYFGRHHIHWHGPKSAHGSRPSPHLCDSQVCCVNFLFPFSTRPEALRALLRPFYPTLEEVLPIEEGRYVAFEWIGEQNYLNERIKRGSIRTRGIYFTSADAAVLFTHTDGRRQIALIEWKYTESYTDNPMQRSSKNTDRVAIYRPLFESQTCPLDKALISDFADLFYEPFYQFMRQQFLAHEMELAHELGADIVSVIHISPACNLDFHRITSPKLRDLGESCIDIWQRLVLQHDRFKSVTTNQLFMNPQVFESMCLQDWWRYISIRYAPLVDLGKLDQIKENSQ